MELLNLDRMRSQVRGYGPLPTVVREFLDGSDADLLQSTQDPESLLYRTVSKKKESEKKAKTEEAKPDAEEKIRPRKWGSGSSLRSCRPMSTWCCTSSVPLLRS